MFRVNYGFDSKYLLTLTGRADSFSAFAENHKWAFFPSAAVAWHLGEESFIKDNASWIDMLKIRLSYGANGNNAISRYQSLDRLYATNGVKYIWGDDGERRQLGLSAERWHRQSRPEVGRRPIRPTSVSTSSFSTDAWAVRSTCIFPIRTIC